MPKKAKSTRNRVVLYLTDCGGSAILSVAARHLGMCGALARALRDDSVLASFVEQLKCYSKTTHRPVTRLSLTELGTALALTLRPGYKPARLALCDWQAQLDEMTAERVPAALQIARDREEAQQWRHLEKQREAEHAAIEKKFAAGERKPKTRRPPTPWFKKNVLDKDPNVPEEEPELFANERTEPTAEAALNEPLYRVPGRTDTASALSIRPTAVVQPVARNHAAEPGLAKPSRAPREECIICEGGQFKDVLPAHDCTLRTRPVFATLQRRVVSQQESAAPDTPLGSEPLIDRIRKAPGFGNISVRNGQVLYGNERYVTPEEWCRLMSHVKV
jgi:hypothetical protein